MPLFGIFRKNKQRVKYHSKRNVFVALFLLLLVGSATIIQLSTKAVDTPIHSVEISSEHSDFSQNTLGSWNVTKSARWTDIGKAQITFKVESVAKTDESKYLDILLVIDTSGSMSGQKMEQVQADAIELANSVLSNTNNQIAIVTFNSTADVLSPFSNDKNSIISIINGLYVSGSTNYNQGLIKAQEVLSGYQSQNDRDLILLFLTDGYPNEESFNEVAQFNTIKTNFPDIIINGIQYEMGNDILPPIARITDSQFIANMDSLNNVLYEASSSPYIYENFVITDYINDAYWNVSDISSISPTLGSATLELDGSSPKVTWDMSGLYRSGSIEYLTINIDLKNEFVLQTGTGLLLPTNTHETIESTLENTPDESINSSKTPILKDTYDVSYDANSPSGCEVQGSVPATSTHAILTTVEFDDSELTCAGYSFKGWHIVNHDVSIINDDFFRMPSENVIIRAIWTKPSISKSVDGTIHQRASADIDISTTFSAKIKILSGQTGATSNTENTSITAFIRADSLPSSFDTTNAANRLSSTNSEAPIYGWFDNGIIYYYTDADDIYLPKNSNSMFYNIHNLSDISGVAGWNSSRVESFSNFLRATSITNTDALNGWDTSNVTDMDYMFQNISTLTDISALSSWDTSNVVSMIELFRGDTSLANIDAISGWNTSSVQNMTRLFYSANSITNLNALSSWNTSNVTDMTSTFGGMNGLTDITGLSNWNVGNVRNMTSLFGSTKNITNIDALINWNTGNVTNMQSMFNSASGLTNIDGAINWNVSNVTTMYSMFSSTTSLTNIDGAINWNTGNVKIMTYMFNSAKSLTNVNGARNWNTSSVTSIQGIFSNASNLTDISGLSSWNTGNVTDMVAAFGGTGITNIDALSAWNTSSVTTMSNMFSSTKSLKNVNGASSWVVTNVTSMQNLFSNTENLEDISGLANWDVTNVTNMSYILSGSNTLTNLDALINWKTNSLTNMHGIFSNMKKLTSISGLLNWNTSNVTDMAWIIQGSNKISSLDGLQNWNTGNVTTLELAFGYLYYAPTIEELRNWNVSNVTSFKDLFEYSSGITDLSPIEGWDVSSAQTMSNAFNGVPAAVTRPSWYNPNL